MDKRITSVFLCMVLVLAMAPIVDQDLLTPKKSEIQIIKDIPTVEAATKKSYVGSEKSNVYHKLYCKYVKRIKKYNKIYFKTKKQAKNWGYRPCKVCHP